MIVPDIKLLLYAYDSESPFHIRAAAWWQGCLSGDEPVLMPKAVVFGFVRVRTNARAFRHPMTAAEAGSHVRSWLDQADADFIRFKGLRWLNPIAGDVPTGSRPDGPDHAGDGESSAQPPPRRTLSESIRRHAIGMRSASLDAMRAHKIKVTIPDTHQIVVRLPDNFPAGEAEITVVSRAVGADPSADDFAWLKAWSASLPPAPTIPLEAIDRSEIYR